MNNKKLGTQWENEYCDRLKEKGYWTHFCAPGKDGGQPCDIIAVKDGKAYLIDCKTCKKKVFRIDRMEFNQINAFKVWKERGNCDNEETRFVAIKHNDNIYEIPYSVIEENYQVRLEE